jgi:thiosulfate/3-mercaptopyruvate sulfurtransferase
MVVSAAQAASGVGDASVLVVDLRKPDAFGVGHVPGAVRLDFAALVRGEPPVGGLLPAVDDLVALFSALGVSPGRQVLAYDDEGNGRAGRLVWTLNAMGHRAASILDGGVAAWGEAGLALEQGPGEPPAMAAFNAAPDASVVADKAWIRQHLGDPDVVFLDTRSPAEYRGEDVRSARGGHLPGAVSFDWVRAMEAEHHRRLRPAQALLRELADLGVTPERQVVAYCQTHHRSSHTYVVLRWLGFDRVRGYPGAWSDWGNDPDVPVSTGSAP